ncbi:hypothetical protein [Streptomyces sp. CB02923]|uniref:hypothetical protein n=1 Tax=Streptomyces sp. CB02923 TaxID=1718985 RepID=UPI0019023FED|nr:hypothetical protein [Streptomyces sp. CB02923]
MPTGPQERRDGLHGSQRVEDTLPSLWIIEIRLDAAHQPGGTFQPVRHGVVEPGSVNSSAMSAGSWR